MTSYLCERCGEQFSDHNQYKQHKIDHQMGKVEDKSVAELMGLPDEVINPPTEPQEQVAEPIVEKSAPKPTKLSAWKQEADKMAAKKAGLKLEYMYVGGCPNCGGVLETITLDDVADDKGKWVVVAWCPHCKKKMRQRLVYKL